MRAQRLPSMLSSSPSRQQCLLNLRHALYIKPAGPCTSVLISQVRTRRNSAFPSPSHFEPKLNRFARFQDASEDILKVRPRNPTDYIEAERIRLRRNEYYRKRMYFAGFGLAVCLVLQAFILFNFGEDPGTPAEELGKQPKGKQGRKQDRLDATPAEQAALQGKDIVVHTVPGSEKILDEDGTELVPTGTSTIPHFPRIIQIPSTSSASGGASTPTTDEYTLLGLGVRTVSFLSIQVYVVGLYVRNADMPAIQQAFVNHINSIASALISTEKDQLRAQLMEKDASLEIWDKILKEAKAKSAVRVVPVRNTDFQHLRDGWVRGITARTQEAARSGSQEYDDDAFGEAMREFKGVFGGKGKAPWGSIVMLLRDERGALKVLYEEVKRRKEGGKEILERAEHEVLGIVPDERISRLIWLGYLGGKSVSSEPARKSIVDGVLDLVARPVGTVGLQVR